MQYAGSSALIHDTLVELMVRGVCEKHPNLKFVLAEFNAGWVAHWLDKVHQGWAREYAKDPLARRRWTFWRFGSANFMPR